MGNSRLFDFLTGGLGNVVSSLGVALSLATLSTVNHVSHEIVRLQEQVSSIKSELQDVRGDFEKELKAQGEQIKLLRERMDRFESKFSVPAIPSASKNVREVNFVSAMAKGRYSCRVCRERGGCRVTTCSDPN